MVNLKGILNSLSQCSAGIETLETSVSELVEFIDYVHDNIILQESVVEEEQQQQQLANQVSKENALKTLNHLIAFISSPSLNQVVVDALSFVLPKLVFRFMGVSKELFQIGERILDRLLSTCSPRDMLTVICEVLDTHKGMCKEPASFTPLFAALSKVLISLQRRHFEHIKEALPAVLKVLQAVSSELDDETQDSYQDLIDRAIGIANSIQEVCQKLEGRQKTQIRALLGLYVLQLMALASSTLGNVKVPLMLQLSKFLPFRNLSYLGLGTGSDLEAITVILGGSSFVYHAECDEYMNYFSLIKQGAFIAVVWGFISNEVAKAADQELGIVKDNLQNSQTTRWQTVGMLKHVLADIPSHQRFDILKASITTNDCPSMAAILIGFVKEEMLKEYSQKGLPKNDEVVVEGDEVCPRLPFWDTNVLELVEMLLKPSQGGPPSLPEQNDAVFLTLSLYFCSFLFEYVGSNKARPFSTMSCLTTLYSTCFIYSQPLQIFIDYGVHRKNKLHWSFVRGYFVEGLHGVAFTFAGSSLTDYGRK
ncbi:hypothetical protein IFM89_010130 [Coptis chinensis]|uniref:Aberrant root formation protein 4 n=1 Tax=Coptis chinensis TaxID=261450 RepID=A0A835LZ55_9MAGN|nr:hypothetical protein IFM89_010130 [Coptis chinensis]